MSSETSTEAVRLKPESSSNALQPWQFFVLAGLGCATAVTYVVRGQGVTVVVLVSIMIGTAALVGMAVLRAVRPLVGPQDERDVIVGQRTRIALEREKNLALRTIKELEFDRAMGKISEPDFQEMSVRLRARASRLMKDLDAGVAYRSEIEQDLVKRLGDQAEKSPVSVVACQKCSTKNDGDARFCKGCGEKL